MLKVERIPSSLSPSAIQAAIKMPNTFYLERLCNDKRKLSEQGGAAAVGTIFDYYCKEHIITQRLPTKIPMLEELKKAIENPDVENYTKAERIFNYYKTHIDTLNKITDVEIHPNKIIEGVPLYGKLDAVIGHREYDFLVPFDWKYSSGSHKPGYTTRRKGISVMSGHTLNSRELKLKDVDLNWWIQGSIYGWLIGIPFGTPFRVVFEHLVVQAEISVAQYDPIVTEDCQEQLMNMIIKPIWESLVSGSFVNRLASKTDLNAVYFASRSESWF